jgi:two-component system phosphate regulon sensor histidine kinase PhoR
MAPRRFDAPLWAVAAIGAMLAALAALAAASRPELAAGLAVLALLTSSGLTIALAIRRVAPAANRAPAGVAAAAPLPYATLADALPDPILVISGFEPDDIVGRRYIFANRAARELLRLGQDSGPLISAIRDPEVLEAADEALFGGVEAECVYEIAGAQAKTLRAQARPLAVAADGTRQAILAFRDETELRSVERTRADFLANASHELRTPLASLSGFIETLRGHARQDEGARDRFLGIMQAQAERMSRLIDDLLSLSRIELNEHVAPEDEVDLTPAVLEVVEAAAPLARLRGVNLQPEVPARGVACIVGDRDQIIQVVQNLVDNALKYSPKGGTVRIRVQAGLSADQAAVGERARTPAQADGAFLSRGRPEERRAVRHGSWAGDRQAHRQPSPRRPAGRECAGAGDDLHHLPAAETGPCAAGCRESVMRLLHGSCTRRAGSSHPPSRRAADEGRADR